MLKLLPALALLAAAQPPQPPPPAQPPQPAPAVRPWQVDWGQYYCSLIRRPAEDRPWAAAFLTVPGGDNTVLMLVPDERGRPVPNGVTSAVLLPSGRSLEVSAHEEWRGRKRVLTVYGFPYELRSELEGAMALELRAGAQVRLSIPVDQARTAVAAHRRCTAGIAREWRLDEAALAALGQRPQSTNRLGYHASDYPAAALRTATQGRVILRITVTADGRAADCAVVATSGNAQIDAISCQVAMRNGRYRPALDASGQPATIATVFTVTWRLPSY
jgi:TonB family protein